jgi:hypothetical protein
MLANVKSLAIRGGAIIPPESLLGMRAGVPREERILQEAHRALVETSLRIELADIEKVRNQQSAPDGGDQIGQALILSFENQPVRRGRRLLSRLMRPVVAVIQVAHDSNPAPLG